MNWLRLAGAGRDWLRIKDDPAQSWSLSSFFFLLTMLEVRLIGRLVDIGTIGLNETEP